VKLLFVDDIRDTRDFFRFAFELEKVEVRLASNGSEAVKMVADEEFDAIVMDVEMPEMNGWDAVRAIRALPNAQKVPILMYTAAMDNGIRARAQEVGADVVLFKPLLPREILSRIDKLVESRASKGSTA
jgi:two-component system alkaline phosphatase synthesis response regulator PhoP